MQNTPPHLDPNKHHARELWKSHVDADVFVVGTGTSLAGFRWSALDGKTTVGLNDAVKVDGFWPTYHLFCDVGIWKRYEQLDIPERTIVVCRPDARKNFIDSPRCRFVERIYRFEHIHHPVLDQSTSELFVTRTVATGGIMMAWKLGARRIFLLGVDGFRRKDAYYHDGRTKGPERRSESHLEDGTGRIVQDRHENWRREMVRLHKAWEGQGLPLGPWPGPGVYNLSRLSTIECWPKVPVEAVLGDCHGRP